MKVTEKLNKKSKIINILSLYLTLVTSVITLIKRRYTRVRRFAVRPMNRRRHLEGHFATIIKDMKSLEADEDQFFRYTRMSLSQYTHLLQLVKPYLQKDITKRPLSPEHRLMITVHYLSEGSSMQEIAWGYRIGKATAHKIIKETCKVLWDVLSPSQLPKPTKEDWESTATEFYQRWNIPNCIGSVDGKHINIQAPKNSGSDFLNYKKSFSIVLMATCDAYYRFIMVDIGAAGSNHDSSVFKLSGFGRSLFNGELDIPASKELPNTNLKMPYYLVGDAAFPLHIHLMRPYPGSNLGVKKNIFNYRLSRSRRTIENAFGILSQRWRILRKPIVASLEVSELIVQATIVLHNFLQTSEKDIPVADRKYCPTGLADHYDCNGDLVPGTWRQNGCYLRSVNRLGSNNPTNSAKIQRDNLAEYFMSREGWLPWQEDYVYRGAVPLI